MPKDFGRDTNIGYPYPSDQEVADTFANRLGAVQALVDTVEPTQESIRAAQEVIKNFVDSVEPTQLAMQETQAAMRGAQDAIQNAQTGMRAKMDKTLLPLTGEEIPEQDNPIVLADFPQYIYWNESDHPFQFGGGSLCRESGSWLNGEEVIVVIETMANECWAVIWDEKFSEESDLEGKKLPQLYNDGSGLRISIKQKSEGDGYHMWSYSFISAEREGGA